MLATEPSFGGGVVVCSDMTRANEPADRRPETSPPAAEPKAAIVCRRMKDGDIDAAVALLSRGFPERSSAYWHRALGRLRDRPLPETYPRYGYVLSDAEELVGIILLIFARTDADRIRANVSSWYVEPPYRAFSGMLLAAPFRLKDVTFINISPAPGTIETITAQGFSRYVDGTFHAMAALGPRVPGVTIRAISPDTRDASPLLVEHAACGCLCFEARIADETHPFVFVPFRSFGNMLPCAQLVYCEDVATFVRFSGPLGRRLVRLGLPSVMLDANGPIEGLVGRYFGGRRLKFFRGATAPRLGDLSATELVYFGP